MTVAAQTVCWQEKSGWLLLLLAFLLVPAGFNNHELWTPDEPREAAISLAMMRSGELLVPQLAGRPFVEKPPLAYIVNAGMLHLFEAWLGPTAALRLAPAFFGAATLAAVFLLARRLLNTVSGAWAVAMLALTPGFVQITHWLLVDNALMFFVTLAVWLLAEAYIGVRQSCVVLAGLAGAAAFLVKGPIGPLMIGLAWLGFLPYMGRSAAPAGAVAPPAIADCRRRFQSLKIFVWHIVAGVAFALPIAGWMLAFYQRGGADLWREWFWNNQFGRFTGAARELGHMRGPFYYLGALAVGGLPWLGLWVWGGVQIVKKKKVRAISQLLSVSRVLPLLTWALGGLVLLSVSATKREIYLSIIYPPLAILTAGLWLKKWPVWLRWWCVVWQWLALAVLAVLIFVPWVAFHQGLLPLCSTLAGVGVSLAALAGAVLWRWRDDSERRRWCGVAALAYLAVLLVLPPFLDNYKNYAPCFRRFAAALPRARQVQVGAWRLDETARGGLYYYCGLVFSEISDTNELFAVLAGEHPSLKMIAADGRKWPPAAELPEWTALAEVSLSARRNKGRKLLLIAGKKN